MVTVVKKVLSSFCCGNNF